jgi:ATP-dependent Clp protease ATP-binding subunit ClpA
VSLERFDEAAERVVAFAQDEARAMGHWYVGTEHLLLGLVADDGPAGRAFAELGVTLEGARAQVVAEVPPSNNEPPGEIPLSPRARGTLEGAPRQAMGLKADVIGTEHLLLALLIERDSRTASVLTLLGCPPDLLRTTVLAQREPPKPKPKSPAAGLAPALAERAREAARARGASTPDAGDLMLALADRSAMLTRALTELGVTPQALRDAIQRARGG